MANYQNKKYILSSMGYYNNCKNINELLTIFVDMDYDYDYDFKTDILCNIQISEIKTLDGVIGNDSDFNYLANIIKNSHLNYQIFLTVDDIQQIKHLFRKQLLTDILTINPDSFITLKDINDLIHDEIDKHSLDCSDKDIILTLRDYEIDVQYKHLEPYNAFEKRINNIIKELNDYNEYSGTLQKDKQHQEFLDRENEIIKLEARLKELKNMK